MSFIISRKSKMLVGGIAREVTEYAKIIKTDPHKPFMVPVMNSLSASRFDTLIAASKEFNKFQLHMYNFKMEEVSE